MLNKQNTTEHISFRKIARKPVSIFVTRVKIIICILLPRKALQICIISRHEQKIQVSHGYHNF